jgi:hypothetical protein
MVEVTPTERAVIRRLRRMDPDERDAHLQILKVYDKSISVFEKRPPRRPRRLPDPEK